MENLLPQIFPVANNCVTLTGELLNSTFLTVLEREKNASLNRREKKTLFYNIIREGTIIYKTTLSL